VAKTGSAVALAEQAARIQTIGAARETLGYATKVLHDAYAGLESVGLVPAGSGFFDRFQAGINEVVGINDDVRDELRSSIEIARAYAEGIYATYAGATSDLLDQEISTLNSTRVAFALQRALTALNSVVDAIENPPITDGATFIEAIRELLDKVVTTVVEAAASVGQGLANAGASLISAFAVPLAVVGVVVVGVVAWRFGLFKGVA
jgi:hypothetical protein